MPTHLEKQWTNRLYFFKLKFVDHFFEFKKTLNHNIQHCKSNNEPFLVYNLPKINISLIVLCFNLLQVLLRRILYFENKISY